MTRPLGNPRANPILESPQVRLDQQLVGLCEACPRGAATSHARHASSTPIDKGGSGIIRPSRAVPGVHNSPSMTRPDASCIDLTCSAHPLLVSRAHAIRRPSGGRVQVRQAGKILVARPLVLIDEEFAPWHARDGTSTPACRALDRCTVMRRDWPSAKRRKYQNSPRGSEPSRRRAPWCLDLLHEARGRLSRVDSRSPRPPTRVPPGVRTSYRRATNPTGHKCCPNWSRARYP